MAKLTVDNGIVTKYSGNVTELIIPDGITEIADPKSFGDKGIFEGHTELTSVILPEGLLKIGESAFNGCSGLTEIVIPESVRDIGRYAFKGCKGLKKIIIPNAVREISEYSFADCSVLLEIIMSENIEIIGYGAFSDCRSLTKITIPKNITKIEGSAFSGCTGLISITFPESNISLGSYTFRDCTGLTDVTIPDCVKYYSDTFNGCRKIRINGNDFSVLDSELFNYAGTSADVVIPDGVKAIGENAFENHAEIISLTIPESVTKIEFSAFRGCTGLSGLLIPNTVTEIGSCAFEDCTGLISISVSEKISKISNGLFRNCSNLTSIVIPNNITEIELSAFAGCDSLSEIKIPASVKKLDCGYSWEKPKILNRIIIDPNSALETLRQPEQLLNNDYEISPLPNIPFSIINSPENKIKYFFEYCKNPELYPKHIADEYEKYGKSQRSRILREAEVQNKTEVIAYYEKKGKKASIRTLSPEEKANLIKEAVDKGTDDDLQQVLKKYKNTGCEPYMLEKAICEGKNSKIKIFLDYGINLPSESDCLNDLFESDNVPEDDKISVCNLLLSNSELHALHNTIAFAACILGYETVIENWKASRKSNEYLNTEEEKNDYRLFSDLTENQCISALDNMVILSDPKTKPVFFLHKTDAEALYHMRVLEYILDHFTVKYHYHTIMQTAVRKNQPAILQLLIETWKERQQQIIKDYYQSNYNSNWRPLFNNDLTELITKSIAVKSTEMLKILNDAGLISPIVQKKDDYFTKGWKSKAFSDAISCGEPEILKILIDNGWISELPSSFNKTNALRAAVEADNPGALEILSQQGWIRNAAARDSLIEFASNEKKNNALAWLLDYKNKTANPKKEEKARDRKERKELESSEVKLETNSKVNEKLWKTSKNADGSYKIERYVGTEYNLTIPAIIGKRKITTIGKRSFAPESYSNSRKENIFWSERKSTITISDGITTIEDEAFLGFATLLSVDIPESVITIENNAFSECSELANITFPRSVTKIGNNAFDWCSEKLVLHVYTDSTAEKYAIENNLKYEVIANE